MADAFYWTMSAGRDGLPVQFELLGFAGNLSLWKLIFVVAAGGKSGTKEKKLHTIFPECLLVAFFGQRSMTERRLMPC